MATMRVEAMPNTIALVLTSESRTQTFEMDLLEAGRLRCLLDRAIQEAAYPVAPCEA